MRLTAWMVDTISVASISSKSSYGDPTYGAAASVKARVENQRRLTKNAKGQEAVSSHTIYTETAIALTDRVWLPGVSSSDTQSAKVPLSVLTHHDKSGGYTYYEVHLA